MFRPKKAFILAAGLGTRMRPLTDNLPKPLVEVQGRTMIDRVLDRLVEGGVEEAIVNAHYHADKLAAHLAKRNDIKIIISHEHERLETGGGLSYAREKLGDEPIYVISTDIIWQDFEVTALQLLAGKWRDELVGLLLLNEVATGYGYDGKGDFLLDDAGGLNWRAEGKTAPYVFTGIQIIDPKVFDRAAVKALGAAFPISKIYKMYLDEFRGAVYDGKWYHIGTPEALYALEKLDESVIIKVLI